MHSGLKFIDFCSGIGAGRLGLTNLGFECVAYSEIDDNAIQTYTTLYGDKEYNYGDLTKIDASLLPDFSLLIGGFPCQTFSIVGKREGFNDERGLIIYSLVEIIKQKNIPYFILENVKGLVSHNGGKTLKTIKNLLEDAGYTVYCKILNSIDYGVPQMRERIYFVGIKNNIKHKEFKWPKAIKSPNLEEFLCDENSEILPPDDKTFNKYLNNKYNIGKFDLKKILSNNYLVLDTRQSDLRLYENKVPTLRTGRHGILYVKNGQLHKISGYEGLLLQGFPKNIAIKAKKINNSRLLSQAGNAMTVNVITAVCKELINCVKEEQVMVDLVKLGSQTAKRGFQNEKDIANKFINWQNDFDAQQWLTIMNYNLEQIEYVKAVVLSGYKADVNVQVQIKLKTAIDTENLQVKLVSNSRGFNQIDKRWLSVYRDLWNIPDDIYTILRHFTGELPPYIDNPTDNRRMFINEMTKADQDKIIEWFSDNKTLILSDIIKGRGQFSAEWVLVAHKSDSNVRWVLKNINEVLQHYSKGDVCISKRGSICLGRVTVQRKGGDNGRQTANMLQFKLDPTELFDI